MLDEAGDSEASSMLLPTMPIKARYRSNQKIYRAEKRKKKKFNEWDRDNKNSSHISI